MNNVYRIVKVNLLSIIALSVLLLAMIMKIVSKSFKKAKDIIGVLALSAAVIIIFEIIGSKGDIMDLILWTALFIALFGIMILCVVLVLSIAGCVIAIITDRLSQGFEAIYAGLYSLFSILFKQCEKDYNQISEMSSPITKGLACIFCKILQGIRKLIALFLKNAIAVMIAVSIALAVGGILAFNAVALRDFGVSYWTIMKLFPKYEIVYGVVLYLTFYFGLSKVLIDLGVDFNNWNLEMNAMMANGNKMDEQPV